MLRIGVCVSTATAACAGELEERLLELAALDRCVLELSKNFRLRIQLNAVIEYFLTLSLIHI